MRNRLRRSAREALRNEYCEDNIFIAIKNPCEHFSTKMPKFRLSAEECFLEVLAVLDDIKEDERKASFILEHRWDKIYNDFRDLADEETEQKELELATSVVLYCVTILLSITGKPLYDTLILQLMGQLDEYGANIEELKNTFMSNIYRMEFEKLKESILDYMKCDVFLSDDIEEMVRGIKEEVTYNENAKSKTLKQQEQFTNRQLIILFEELLGVTLLSGVAVNINAFSKLVGMVSGRSPGSIRNNIPQNGLDYKNDEQTKKDTEYVASFVEPISKKIADNIKINVE